MKHELPEAIQKMKDTITPEQRAEAAAIMEPFVTGITELLEENLKTPRDFYGALGGLGHILAGMFASVGITDSEERAFEEIDTWVQVLKSATQSQIKAMQADPIIAGLKAGAKEVGTA